MDSAGNLYGTATQGGAHFEGIAFKIDSAGRETILHSFGASATDGLDPAGGLIMDSAGNLYGTTPQGGANVSGTVFKIDSTEKESILYSFASSPTDGRWPSLYMGLIMDSAGSLYGMTSAGGENHLNSYGDGTAFKMGLDGTVTILHSFGATANDGLVPIGSLTVDSAGNLYGTTMNGGANFGKMINGKVSGGGTVFVID